MDGRDLDDEVNEDNRLTGRLLEPGSEDVDSTDLEKDSVAEVVLDHDDAELSAEESAMHITESP